MENCKVIEISTSIELGYKKIQIQRYNFQHLNLCFNTSIVDRSNSLKIQRVYPMIHYSNNEHTSVCTCTLPNHKHIMAFGFQVLQIFIESFVSDLQDSQTRRHCLLKIEIGLSPNPIYKMFYITLEDIHKHTLIHPWLFTFQFNRFSFYLYYFGYV